MRRLWPCGVLKSTLREYFEGGEMIWEGWESCLKLATSLKLGRMVLMVQLVLPLPFCYSVCRCREHNPFDLLAQTIFKLFEPSIHFYFFYPID